MRVVTIISDEGHPGFNLLKTSCKLRNVALIPLSCDQENYTNNRMKVEILDKYLSTLDDDEIVMFTDGYDSIMLAREDEILHKYKSANVEILFSAETNCYPDSSLISVYPGTGNSPYRFLNSGGFVGRSKSIRNKIALELKSKPEHDSCDQYFWTLRYINDSETIHLDSNMRIFCTLSPEKGGEGFKSRDISNYRDYFIKMNEWFENTFTVDDKDRLVFKNAGSKPCVLHFNGKSKCVISSQLLLSMINGLSNDVINLMKTYVVVGNNPKFTEDFVTFIGNRQILATTGLDQ